MTIASEILQKKGLSHKAPFFARLKDCYVLNHPQSNKRTLHVALDLEGSDITYDVGSCVGILPKNPPQSVQQLITVLGYPASTIITHKKTGEQLSLKNFFFHHANINALNSQFLQLLCRYKPTEFLGELLADKERMKTYVHARDPWSFFKEWDVSLLPLQEICDCFQPLLPRYYSIASSQKWVGNEVHLMVATFYYEHAGQRKQGITSSFIWDTCEINSSLLPIFIQKNDRFVPPSDPHTPMIMIGPGTGIAPFIGFIQERQKGENWLFFGEQKSQYDYYHEPFLTSCVDKGFLRIDTAFSRDQEKKIYVQDKMLQHAEELWNWLQRGAHVYICGDAKNMAKDVIRTLHTIIEQQGRFSAEAADKYLSRLRKERRLLMDVY